MKKNFNGKATVIIEGLSHPYAAELTSTIKIIAEAQKVTVEEATKRFIVAAMLGVYKNAEFVKESLEHAERQHGGNSLGYYDDKDSQWHVDLVNNTIEFT